MKVYIHILIAIFTLFCLCNGTRLADSFLIQANQRLRDLNSLVCTSVSCVGQGAVCDSTHVCNSASLECSSTCQVRPTVTQACSSLACFDPTYDITCSSTCQYAGTFGPGESGCGTVPANTIASQVCSQSPVFTPLLACTNNVCLPPGVTSVGSGTACGVAAVGFEECGPGLSCQSGTCKAWVTAGGTCSLVTDCVPTADCISSKCVTYFTQPSGATCLSDLDCVTSAFCSAGTCTNNVGNGNTGCQSDSDCSTHQFCECTGSGNNTQCIGEENSFIDTSGKIMALLNCVQSNNCNAVGALTGSTGVEFVPGGCYDQHCHSELASVLGGGSVCGASILSLSLFAVLSSFLLVLLFNM